MQAGAARAVEPVGAVVPAEAEVTAAQGQAERAAQAAVRVAEAEKVARGLAPVAAERPVAHQGHRVGLWVRLTRITTTIP